MGLRHCPNVGWEGPQQFATSLLSMASLDPVRAIFSMSSQNPHTPNRHEGSNSWERRASVGTLGQRRAWNGTSSVPHVARQRNPLTGSVADVCILGQATVGLSFQTEPTRKAWEANGRKNEPIEAPGSARAVSQVVHPGSTVFRRLDVFDAVASVERAGKGSS